MRKIEVLDVKRSQAINIGMKVLPPPRAISTAIVKMDPSIINREGIEVCNISGSTSKFVCNRFYTFFYLCVSKEGIIRYTGG